MNRDPLELSSDSIAAIEKYGEAMANSRMTLASDTIFALMTVRMTSSADNLAANVAATIREHLLSIELTQHERDSLIALLEEHFGRPRPGTTA